MFSTIFFYYFQHRHIKSTTITKKYNKNIQNDIIGIYDADGNQIVKYVYDAWGNHKTFVLYNGKFVDISLNNDYTDDDYQGKVQLATLNPFRYRSYYFDEETGLYYLNTRYYDPEFGRFINADNISILSEGKDLFNGLNLFVYCGSNPVNNIDETGEAWWDWLWKITLAIVGVVAIAALTAITAGAFAVALGASASVVSGVVSGALIGGLVSGGLSIINQALNGIDNFNFGTIFIDAFSGAAFGAITAGSSGIGSFTAKVAGGIGKVFLSGFSTALHSANEGLSFDETAKSVLKQMITTGILQLIFIGSGNVFGKYSKSVGNINILKKLINKFNSNINLQIIITRGFIGIIDILQEKLF